MLDFAILGFFMGLHTKLYRPLHRQTVMGRKWHQAIL